MHGHAYTEQTAMLCQMRMQEEITMEEQLDFIRQEKGLYQPKTTPEIVDVPKMTFLAVDGRGNPNEPDGEYGKAVDHFTRALLAEDKGLRRNASYNLANSLVRRGEAVPGKDEKKKAKKADVEVLTYVEIGSFRHGACPDCGWQGPGRRAREKATRDYLDHAKECKKR